mgnify:CR=1 FL=1
MHEADLLQWSIFQQGWEFSVKAFYEGFLVEADIEVEGKMDEGGSVGLEEYMTPLLIYQWKDVEGTD